MKKIILGLLFGLIVIGGIFGEEIQIATRGFAEYSFTATVKGDVYRNDQDGKIFYFYKGSPSIDIKKYEDDIKESVWGTVDTDFWLGVYKLAYVFNSVGIEFAIEPGDTLVSESDNVGVTSFSKTISVPEGYEYNMIRFISYRKDGFTNNDLFSTSRSNDEIYFYKDSRPPNLLVYVNNSYIPNGKTIEWTNSEQYISSKAFDYGGTPGRADYKRLKKVGLNDNSWKCTAYNNITNESFQITSFQSDSSFKALDGDYTYTISVADLLGNTAEKTVRIKYDNTPPPAASSTVQTMTLTPSAWTSGTVNLTIVASDNPCGSGIQTISYSSNNGTSGSFTRNASDPSPHSLTRTITGISKNQTIKFTVTDRVGKSGPAFTKTISNIDNLPPNTSVKFYTDTTRTDTQVTDVAKWISYKQLYLDLDQTDPSNTDYGSSGVYSVTYLEENKYWRQFIGGDVDTRNIVAGDGNHTIEYTVVDNVGNQVKKSTWLALDNTTATLSLLNAEKESEVFNETSWHNTKPQSFVLKATELANNSGVEYSKLKFITDNVDINETYSNLYEQNGSKNNLFDQRQKYSVVGEGVWKISAQATDRAGNISEKEFTVHIDSTVPTGSITYGTALEVSKGETNRTRAPLVITALDQIPLRENTNATELKSSGVSKIYVWNGRTDYNGSLPEVYNTITDIIPDSSGNVDITLNDNWVTHLNSDENITKAVVLQLKTPVSGQEIRVKVSNWPLLTETSELATTVCMYVVDGAGNVSFNEKADGVKHENNKLAYAKNIIYDITPPKAPNLVVRNDKVIGMPYMSVDWNSSFSAKDIVRGRLYYKYGEAASYSEKDIFNGDRNVTIETKIKANPAEVGYNTPFYVKLSVSDLAGNTNKTEEIAGYTLADIISVKTDLPADVNEDNEYRDNIDGLGKVLKLPVAAGTRLDTAGYGTQILGYRLKGSTGAFTEVAGNSKANNFTLANIEPRGVYECYLVSVNTAGSRDESEKNSLFEITVPNARPALPAAPVLANGDSGYINKDNKYSFNGLAGKDTVDGDPVTTTIHFEITGGGETKSLVIPAEGTNYTSYPVSAIFTDNSTKAAAEGKIHVQSGDQVTWYVSVSDGVTTVSQDKNSQGKTFTFDFDKPVIVFNKDSYSEGNSTFFTNKTSVTFDTFEDEHSGIAALTYEYTNLVSGTVYTSPGTTVTHLDAIPLAEGKYNLEINATDKAGNMVTARLDGLFVDTTAPSISEIYADTEGNNPVRTDNYELTLRAVDSGVVESGIATFDYVLFDNGQKVLDGSKPVERANFDGDSLIEENRSITLDLTGLEDRLAPYVLAYSLTDYAENTAAWQSVALVVDRTPPELGTITINGNKVNDIWYTSALAVPYTAVDTESGIKQKYYRMNKAATPNVVTTWSKSLSDAADKANYSHGESYVIEFRAENNAGGFSAVESRTVCVDTTKPVVNTFTSTYASRDSNATIGEKVIVSVSAGDSVSYLSKYRLTLGTDSDKQALSALLNGSGSIEVVNPENERDFAIVIPEGAADGTYYPYITITDSAGNTISEYRGEAFVVDSSVKSLVVNSSKYSQYDDKLIASWDLVNSDAPVKGITYSVSETGNGVVAEGSLANLGSRVFSIDVNTTSGKEYSIELTAEFEGLSSLTGKSAAIRVDHSDPVIPAEGFIVPGYAADSNFRVFYAFDDAESGIDTITLDIFHYEHPQLSVETYNSLKGNQIIVDSYIYNPDEGNYQINPGFTVEMMDEVETFFAENDFRNDLSNGSIILPSNIAGWKTIERDALNKKLVLPENGRVYVEIEGTNGAGRTTSRKSGLIKIDNSPAPVFTVNTPDLINSKQDITATWNVNSDDESGITSYKWAFYDTSKTNNYEVTEWNTLELNESFYPKAVIEKDSDRAGTFKFVVKAVNRAGLETEVVSSSIIVDATAPIKPVIALGEVVADEVKEIYYIPEIKNLDLGISSIDIETGISKYLYTWGVKSVLDTKIAQSISEKESFWISETDNDEKFQTVTIDQEIVKTFSTDSKNPVFFASIAYNGVDDYSEAGISMPAVLAEDSPYVYGVTGSAAGNLLTFNWHLGNTATPLIDVTVELAVQPFAGGTPVKQSWNYSDSGAGICDFKSLESCVIDAASLPEGTFVLSVSAKSAAGKISDINDRSAQSGIVIVDTTKPEAGFAYQDFYTHETLDTTAEGNDPESGITAYEYQLGTMNDPAKYSEGWENIEINGTTVSSVRIMRDDIASIPDGEELHVSVRARNGVGLWSNPAVTESILVDHTAPEIGTISLPLYTNNRTQIHDVAALLDDNESGIARYEIAISAEKGGDFLGDVYSYTGDMEGQFEVNETVTGIVGLEDNGTYYAAIRALNQAGNWSSWVYSDVFVEADYTYPVMTLVRNREGLSYPLFNERSFNMPFVMSEDVEAEITVRSIMENNATVYTSLYGGGDNNDTFVFSGSTGYYEVSSVLTDKAGNISKNNDTIRFNNAPFFILSGSSEMADGYPVYGSYSTPGQPITITPETNSTIIEGYAEDYPLTYEWIVSDTGEVITEYQQNSGDDANRTLDYRLYQKDNNTTHSTWTVSLKITDRWGKSSVVGNAALHVENTHSGTLYVDEYWRGGHNVNGEVVVPAGLTLSILEDVLNPADNTVITFMNANSGITAYGSVDILGTSLRPVMLAGSQSTDTSVYTWEGDWLGLRLYGGASVSHALIRYARAGITVLDGSLVLIDHTTFEDNLFGLHIYDGSARVLDSIFKNNRLYGIKTDMPADSVQVTDSRFVGTGLTGNGFNYYDFTETALTASELNDVAGNENNTYSEQ